MNKDATPVDRLPTIEDRVTRQRFYLAQTAFGLVLTDASGYRLGAYFTTGEDALAFLVEYTRNPCFLR